MKTNAAKADGRIVVTVAVCEAPNQTLKSTNADVEDQEVAVSVSQCNPWQVLGYSGGGVGGVDGGVAGGDCHEQYDTVT